MYQLFGMHLSHRGGNVLSASQARAWAHGTIGALLQAAPDKAKERVPAAHAAELIATAAYHGLDEVWIGLHPVLLMGKLPRG
jgi:hypothetical protein